MSFKKRIIVQKRYYTGAMEATAKHRLIAEFDPFTPQQYVMTSYRLDTDIESNTGQHSRTTTLRPNPDEETNIISGAATRGSNASNASEDTKVTVNKDTVYTGAKKVTEDHKSARQKDIYERRFDSGEIEFRDFQHRKDTRRPVAVTLDTPPNSTRTQLPVTEKRHVTIIGQEELPMESSLPTANGQSTGVCTRREYYECDVQHKVPIYRSTRTRYSEESDLKYDVRSRSPERTVSSFRKRPIKHRLSYSRSPSIEMKSKSYERPTVRDSNRSNLRLKKSPTFKDNTATDREQRHRTLASEDSNKRPSRHRSPSRSDRPIRGFRQRQRSKERTSEHYCTRR